MLALYQFCTFRCLTHAFNISFPVSGNEFCAVTLSTTPYRSNGRILPTSFAYAQISRVYDVIINYRSAPIALRRNVIAVGAVRTPFGEALSTCIQEESVKNPSINRQLRELLYQALETERSGVKIYEAALSCAENEDLKREWMEYLDQTRTHEQVLLELFEQLGLDPATVTPGREVVAHIADSLVTAMEMAKFQGSPATAQLVAGECVILAGSSDHQNWEQIGDLAAHGQGEEADTLRAAFEALDHEQAHHLYHTEGFIREWGCRYFVRDKPRATASMY